MSGAGFSLWILDLARINPHRLKPAPLRSHKVRGIGVEKKGRKYKSLIVIKMDKQTV
jgi:hypothetical protein